MTTFLICGSTRPKRLYIRRLGSVKSAMINIKSNPDIQSLISLVPKAKVLLWIKPGKVIELPLSMMRNKDYNYIVDFVLCYK